MWILETKIEHWDLPRLKRVSLSKVKKKKNPPPCFFLMTTQLHKSGIIIGQWNQASTGTGEPVCPHSENVTCHNKMHSLEVSYGAGNLALKEEFSKKQKFLNMTIVLSFPVKTYFVIFKAVWLFIFSFYIKSVKLCNQFILKFCRQNKIL